MFKIKDIRNINTKIRVGEIFSLMTPYYLLSRKEFDIPHAITPSEFISFEELIEFKKDIRDLKLVPIKDKRQHDLYNSLNKKELLGTVNSYLEDSDITCTENSYPYWLPVDVNQYLIWVKAGIDEIILYFFISRLLSKLKVPISKVIIFERPSDTKSILIKGTFPAVRHIHLWTKRISS